MATHRGKALTMIPVMVDDEPFLRAYREVKINLQAPLVSGAGPSRDGGVTGDSNLGLWH